MIQSSPTAASSSNYLPIFDSALEAYKKKTKNDLTSHPLLGKLESCHSPDAILTTLRREILGFEQPHSSDEKSTKWLSSTVKVLCAFSPAISTGVGQVSLISLVRNHHPDPYPVDMSTRGCHFHGNWHPSFREGSLSLALAIVVLKSHSGGYRCRH